MVEGKEMVEIPRPGPSSTSSSYTAGLGSQASLNSLGQQPYLQVAAGTRLLDLTDALIHNL